MTASTAHGSGPAAAPRAGPAPPGLRLFVAAAGQLLALDAALVERALAHGEAEVAVLPIARLRPGAVVKLSQDGRTCAGWDLGALLGAPPSARAWVLLRFTAGDRALPLALGVDACLSVGALPAAPLGWLPGCLLPERPLAVTAAFATGALPARLRAVAALGLVLDLGALWTPAELRLSALIADEHAAGAQRGGGAA